MGRRRMKSKTNHLRGTIVLIDFSRTLWMWCRCGAPTDEQTFSFILYYVGGNTKGSFKVCFEFMQMESNKFSPSMMLSASHTKGNSGGRPSSHEKWESFSRWLFRGAAWKIWKAPESSREIIYVAWRLWRRKIALWFRGHEGNPDWIVRNMPLSFHSRSYVSCGRTRTLSGKTWKFKAIRLMEFVMNDLPRLARDSEADLDDFSHPRV